MVEYSPKILASEEKPPIRDLTGEELSYKETRFSVFTDAADFSSRSPKSS